MNKARETAEDIRRLYSRLLREKAEGSELYHLTPSEAGSVLAGLRYLAAELDGVWAPLPRNASTSEVSS